jgi:hypothetical protein
MYAKNPRREILFYYSHHKITYKMYYFANKLVLITLEEKEIVFPSIHHKNLYINIDTLDIMIITYS